MNVVKPRTFVQHSLSMISTLNLSRRIFPQVFGCISLSKVDFLFLED